MKITFRSRLRAFLYNNAPATIDEIVAAVGKHLTATQCLRAYDRQYKYNKKRRETRNPKTLEEKVKLGSRRIIMEEVWKLAGPAHDGKYKLAS